MASKAEKLLAKGQGLEKKGKLEKALEAYRDGCRQAPYDPDLWTARANAAETLGLTGEAAEALFHVADLFARAGMPAEALELAKKVLKLDAGHGGARRFKRMLEARMEEAAAEPQAAGLGPQASDETPQPAAEPAPVPVNGDGNAVPEREPETVPAEAKPEPEPEPEPAVVAVAPTPTNGAHRPDTSAPALLEFAIGNETTETALDSISLGDRVPGASSLPAPSGSAGTSSEIPLDDGGTVDVIQAVASTITSSPLLSELDSELIRLLIDSGSLVHRNAGEVIFRHGEIGSSLFLILKGEVVVQREVDGYARDLARLRAGAFFGEMALLTNMPRSATVRVHKDVDLLEISRRDVRDLVDRDPRVLKLLMRFFRARLVGTLLQTSPLFQAFSREERRQLVSRFRLRELGPDFVVVREGQGTEGLFLVLVGDLAVTQRQKDQDVTLAELGPGDVFGEMSLLDGAPAIATVKTRGRAWLLLLGRDDFAATVATHPEVKAHLAALAELRREKNRSATRDTRAPLREEHLEPV